MKAFFVDGSLFLLNILLKVKRIIVWLLSRIFKLVGRLFIYWPATKIYKLYLHLRRRMINRYQQNAWLAVITFLLIALFIVLYNQQESNQLMAAEDLVRGTWLSRLVGDEFNQFNDIVVDNQPPREFIVNNPAIITNNLSTLDLAKSTDLTTVLGMTTDRWAYTLGPVSLPQVNIQGTTSTAPSRAITYYTVKIGDTLSGIAKAFGVSINTIAWQNGLSPNALLRPGDKLTILPVSGVLHKVKAGDSLSKIAKQYGVKTADIIAYNNLSGDKVVIGQSLIIPGGQPPSTLASQITQAVKSNVQQVFTSAKETAQKSLTSSGSGMTWPTVGHRITQYYSWRHTGIDIGNKVGTPIYAADSGRVEIAATGWNGGYGTTIVINHGKLKTRYGHLSRLYVKAGENVVKGQVIGEMGSTGRSTGSHLHFEVLSGNVRYNPLNYVH
ncbi:M23 family metallopeptidase [Patescibacteria group bacterium]|jgi:murein DD-endopeptidase MepM/ murein hydrolase activator NlpD|nr:M23 family metallopeptidase [Patescibacteria group bacterium]HPD07970.1 M23 family metallopeptidase [bacterium]HRT11159.1 M23 family metallopeptidase [Patescibacteria group bacterium]HRU89998.1 M23 family metallopeptidase [Patescibacteria group bacterium]